MNIENTMPCALTTAGSDSGGGAGIQADLRTFSFMGVFGTSATAAVTSQNPTEVRRVDAMEPECVAEQIKTVRAKLNIKGAKTGMLFAPHIIEETVKALSGRDFKLVSDPVMISTSGAKLLADDALDAVKNILLPAADAITPNIPEAELITGLKIDSRESMVKAACLMAERYNALIILKGGHAAESSYADDIAATRDGTFMLRSKWVKAGPHAGHGTGCTFSAALTAAFAKGMDTEKALLEAKAFVTASLINARLIGEGIYAMFPPDEKTMNQARAEIRTVKL